MDYIYQNFSAGLNLGIDPAKLPEGYYPFLSLARNRFNKLKPIKLPVELTKGLPTDGVKFQGIYGFDNILVLFIDGECYYRDFNSTLDRFTRLSSVALSANVDKIYVEAIPASTVNFKRESVDGQASSSVGLNTRDSESPAALLVTDGVNQPIVIFPDGSSRTTKTYSEWTNAIGQREYVPVGIMPLFVGGILYMVAQDNQGVYNKILRSVTGRPLDFMVNIDQDGNKALVEEEGDAYTVATGVSFSGITAINSLPAIGNSLLVSTKNKTYILEPDTTNTIFGEPSFIVRGLFDTGAVNQFSVADVKGDTVFIDQTSLRSFNALSSTVDISRTDIFSQPVQEMFSDGILQSASLACLTTFDNYVLFSLTTTKGPAVIVYDTVTDSFSAIDQYPGVGHIVQFAKVKLNGSNRLFFYTDDSRLYEAFVGDTATARLLLPDSVIVGGGSLTKATLGLSHIKSDGALQLTEFVDDVRLSPVSRQISSDLVTTTPIPQPKTPQLVEFNKDIVVDFSSTSKAGLRRSLFIEWDMDAELTFIQLEHKEHKLGVGFKEQSRIFNISATTKTSDKKSFTFFADNGTLSAPVITIADLVKARKPDLITGGGDHRYGAVGTFTTEFMTLFQKYWENNRIYLALGNHDIDGDDGQEITSYLRYPNTSRYFVIELDHETDLWFLNSGYNTAGSLVEIHGNTIGSIQYNWFKRTRLARGKKINIGIFHHPPYSNGGSYKPGYADLRWDFNKYLNLVLNGHEHLYERFVVDGLTYITNGAGGHSLRDFASEINVAGSKARYNADYCYTLIEKDRFNLLARTYNTSNAMVDETVIHV